MGLSPLFAQKLQPDVIVLGNSNAALAAAIQAARSNVKTLLILQAGGLNLSPFAVQSNTTGLAKELAERYSEQPNTNFDKQAASLKALAWTDSIKNLSVIKNVNWIKVTKSGSAWTFKLSDKRSAKARVLVCDTDPRLQQHIKLIDTNGVLWQDFRTEQNNYKTGIAARFAEKGLQFVTLYHIINPQTENYLEIKDPQSMALGQALGATAAWAAFFKRNTSESDLRTIQAELLNFNSVLVPLADNELKPAQQKNIQMLLLSGIIRPSYQKGKYYFYPKQLIEKDEIEAGMIDHFYKAQIWFEDHPEKELKLRSFIELICYIGNKAVESTQKDIEKKWQSSFGFSSNFDLDSRVSREVFATLLINYASPFSLSINRNGQVIH